MAKKSVKLDIGTVYEKTSGGGYYYRFQIEGKRKTVSLQTKNFKDAVAKAKELVPITKSTTVETISAHTQHARGLATKKKSLRLIDAWDAYSKHPDRATPATVAEQESYRATFDEFIKFVDGKDMDVEEITSEHAENFAQAMRKQKLAVDTHNRKIRRLKKIFTVLVDYREQDPFSAKSLFRKKREEQDNGGIRRISFSKDQEDELLKTLDDDSNIVMNKPEIRVVYHLGMFTGQRMKDCVLLTWDRVDLNRKRIWVKQFKTGKEVTIPLAPQLIEALKGALSWQRNNYVCPNVAARYNKVDTKGKNTGNNLVNIDVLRVIKWIGLEPSVEVPGRKKKVNVYGFHSLRHSFVTHCAEAGVPKAVVLSIIGTNSDIVDKHYTHIGEEAQEKAINDIFGDSNQISDRRRIEKALSIIDELSKKSKVVQKIEKVLRD